MFSFEKPLLACYLPLGDPSINFDLTRVYNACGVDIFELGIPSRNPFMDGPVIRASMERALAASSDNTDPAEVLQAIVTDYPDRYIVVMGYEELQIKSLCVNGFPVFDAVLRVGEDRSRDARFVNRVVFVPYHMDEFDIDRARQSTAYVMLQAADGKTGPRSSLDGSCREKIRCLKDAGVKVPVLLGFGISTAAQAACAIATGADGVIIGSACLVKAEAGEDSLREFLASVRGAMDAVHG